MCLKTMVSVPAQIHYPATAFKDLPRLGPVPQLAPEMAPSLAQAQGTKPAPALAPDFAQQLQTYLMSCLHSELQLQPSGKQLYPQIPGVRRRAYRHEALALLLGPLEALSQQGQETAVLQTWLALVQWQQQAWQQCLELRQQIALAASLEPVQQSSGQSKGRALQALVTARSQLEFSYAECEKLANLLDQLERHAAPAQALKALEAEYIEVLIELGHLQEALDQHWLSMA